MGSDPFSLDEGDACLMTRISQQRFEELYALHIAAWDESASSTGAELLHLTECDLGGIDMSNRDLRSCHLLGCDLRSCNLTGTNISHSELMLSDLRGANLTGVIDEGTDYTGCVR